MDCPTNESMWKKRAERYRCQNEDIYHCLLLKDKTSLKEVCIKQARIGKGYCPIITRHNYLDWALCNTTGCPNDTYTSDEVYKYPICFMTTHTGPIRTTSNDMGTNVQSLIGVGIAMFILPILAFCVYVRRSQFRGCKGGICRSLASDAENGTNNREPLLFKDNENNETVEGVLQELHNSNVILIHGTLGNGVSKTGKEATKDFIQKHSDWEYQRINYDDCSDTPLAEKTIIFVDGWFGIWNENPCKVNDVEKALKKIRNSIDNVQLCKVILGIREDIYEKYKKLFNSNLPSNFRHLYLDSIRARQNKELEQQLKRTLNKVNCKKRKCSCATLNIQGIKDKYHELGNHLKVEILASHHCLITKFMECGDLLETLVCHFMELQKKKKRLYECLMYIVIKGKYKIGDDVDSDVKKEFHFGITSESYKDCKSLDKYTKKMPGKDLVNIKNAATPPNQEYIVFEYVFLYLCAFHSLFKMQPKMVMKHCNMDAVLQIVRPDEADQDGDGIKFCAKAENEYVTYFYKEVVKRTPGLEDTFCGHPLVKHAIGTEV